MNEERRWYVIQSKPHNEERVAVQLAEQAGLDVYFPKIEVFSPRKGVRTKVVKPLFPNYIFAKLIMPDDWKLVTYTRGVARMLGDWRQASWVDNAVMDAIMKREDEKDRLIHYYHFEPSENVVVKSGPLKDLYGIFERYVDDRGRVRILLSLIGYQASVEMEAEHLEKL